MLCAVSIGTSCDSQEGNNGHFLIVCTFHFPSLAPAGNIAPRLTGSDLSRVTGSERSALVMQCPLQAYPLPLHRYVICVGIFLGILLQEAHDSFFVMSVKNWHSVFGPHQLVWWMIIAKTSFISGKFIVTMVRFNIFTVVLLLYSVNFGFLLFLVNALCIHYR